MARGQWRKGQSVAQGLCCTVQHPLMSLFPLHPIATKIANSIYAHTLTCNENSPDDPSATINLLRSGIVVCAIADHATGSTLTAPDENEALSTRPLPPSPSRSVARSRLHLACDRGPPMPAARCIQTVITRILTTMVPQMK